MKSFLSAFVVVIMIIIVLLVIIIIGFVYVIEALGIWCHSYLHLFGVAVLASIRCLLVVCFCI